MIDANLPFSTNFLSLSLVTPGARATVLPFMSSVASFATSSDEEHHQHKHCKHYAVHFGSEGKESGATVELLMSVRVIGVGVC